MKYGHQVIITHLVTIVYKVHMEFLWKKCDYLVLPKFIRETVNKGCDHQACSTLLSATWVIQQIHQPEDSLEDNALTSHHHPISYNWVFQEGFDQKEVIDRPSLSVVPWNLKLLNIEHL